MLFPHGEPALFEHRVVGSEDSHGNPTETFGTAVLVVGGAFVPGGSVESFTPGRDSVVTSPTYYIPGDAAKPVISPRDRVTIRGLLFQVDGQPAEWVSPFTGWAPGIVVNLERVDG